MGQYAYWTCETASSFAYFQLKKLLVTIQMIDWSVDFPFAELVHHGNMNTM